MEHITIEQAKDLAEIEIEKLLQLWERSVRATHLFLTEENIVGLLPFVKIGILGIKKLFIGKGQSGELVGFMGVDNDKIEMLFINPELFGKGIGKFFVTHAVNNLGVNFVDVNEQNEQALGFYEHLGFTVYGRSEFDEQGNPFPILHMKFSREK